jgi:hypothetical protein
VKDEGHPLAKERIAELIEGARAAVGRIEPRQPSMDSNDFFKATWTASRAAGFLEAVALMDPSLANEAVTHFESVAELVGRLRAAGGDDPGATDLNRSGDRRLVSRAEGTVRRTAVRRVVSDRRTQARRQLGDRRTWQVEG